MPSIFIWKSDSPNSSKDFVRCYLGSNWILEDNNNGSSMSYQLIQQQTINYNNCSILINNAKLMPTDWIGSELLEVIQCPYQLVKSDKYAKYEIIGEWNRVILSNTLELTENICNIEFNNILNWLKHINNISKITSYSKDIKQESNNKTTKYNKEYNIKHSTNIKHTTNNIIENITKNISQIQSFEETILKFNNITKEQLLGINFNTLLVNTSNNIFDNKSIYNSYNNLYNNNNNKTNKINKYDVKIASDNMMSIPLCSV